MQFLFVQASDEASELKRKGPTRIHQPPLLAPELRPRPPLPFPRAPRPRPRPRERALGVGAQAGCFPLPLPLPFPFAFPFPFGDFLLPLPLPFDALPPAVLGVDSCFERQFSTTADLLALAFAFTASAE